MTKKEHRRYCQKVAKALPCDWAINPQLERHVVRAAASSAEFEKRPAMIDIAVYRSHEATSPVVILRTPKVQDMTIKDAIYAVQNEADRQHALPPWERSWSKGQHTFGATITAGDALWAKKGDAGSFLEVDSLLSGDTLSLVAKLPSQ